MILRLASRNRVALFLEIRRLKKEIVVHEKAPPTIQPEPAVMAQVKGANYALSRQAGHRISQR